MIRLERTTANTSSYHVYHDVTDVYLGDAIQYEDGFYYFHFANDKNSSYWQAYVLRGIADKLDELNKKWDEHLRKNLK